MLIAIIDSFKYQVLSAKCQLLTAAFNESPRLPY
jgi:hypothetical protein